MRISTRLPVIAVLTALAALALAAPAFAAGPGQQTGVIQNHWHRNQMPEVPYAALLPLAGVGAVVLLRRRRAKVG